MAEEIIFIVVLITSFLQILHIFEEISLESYNLIKRENSKKTYFRVALILVLLNYIILFLLYLKNVVGYYAAFYTVLMSIGNTLAHLILYCKDKKRLGYGLTTSIPLGIAGFILLILLIQHLFL